MAKRIKWKTETRTIADLIPHERNPRQMTEKQVADLTASLERFDLAEIPVINTNNTLLAGHQRCRILNLLGRGEETIDVRVPTRKLTEAEADEYLIRSNKNTGEWDWDKLSEFDSEKLVDMGFEDFEVAFDSGEDIDYSILGEDDEDGDSAAESLTNGVKRALLIDFEPGDYEEAFALAKSIRAGDIYLGGIVLTALRAADPDRETE